MYAWIWRRLPGSAPVKTLLCAVLSAAVVVALFLYAFPRVESLAPFGAATVGADPDAAR
ncbi:hypothetical protein ACIQWN_38145 [Streptomyces vinaceus]|uniref:hypothetical protein n=1 Tax=Streptomyces vinaceus TaxID=1960 RepID=UPI0037FF54D1